MDKTQEGGRVYLRAFQEFEAKIYLRTLLTLIQHNYVDVGISLLIMLVHEKKQKKKIQTIMSGK